LRIWQLRYSERRGAFRGATRVLSKNEGHKFSWIALKPLHHYLTEILKGRSKRLRKRSRGGKLEKEGKEEKKKIRSESGALPLLSACPGGGTVIEGKRRRRIGRKKLKHERRKVEEDHCKIDEKDVL